MDWQDQLSRHEVLGLIQAYFRVCIENVSETK